ncbi:MAG: ABC-type transporter, integral rane subunit [Patescibacteria group bacterium]|nr:ABC-type transporter, integral rane subunit [Patescibacteria group bacterium]
MWLSNMLAHDFIRNAFIAGTGIALASGLTGYFLVLRGQVFSSDALGHVAFAGALAALVFGFDARLGLFAFTIAAAVGLGLVGARGRADDVVIGGFFAWVLGLGALFLTLYTTSNSAANGTKGINTLFGSIFGLSHPEAVAAAWIGAVVSVAVVVMARPLLFASLDQAVAAARGVHVQAISLVFLVLVGITTAEATGAVGALLVLGLLAAPAGAAHRLTSRPFRAMWFSAAFAILSVWLGLVLAYAAPRLPPSFTILTVASLIYLIAATIGRVSRRWENNLPV